MSLNNLKNAQIPSKPDKLLKLSEAERILRTVLNTAPSRPTLISYIESGKLRGGKHPFNKYYVHKSSLDEFIEQMLKNIT